MTLSSCVTPTKTAKEANQVENNDPLHDHSGANVTLKKEKAEESKSVCVKDGVQNIVGAVNTISK